MNDNTTMIFKGLLFLILLFAVYKVLQKFGIFDDAKDRGRTGLMTNKSLSTTDLKDFGNVKGQNLLNGTDATDIADAIYNAKGYVYDTDDKAIAALKRVKNKNQLKQVSFAFNKVYSRDLANYLDFMSKENMKIANDYINALPTN